MMWLVNKLVKINEFIAQVIRDPWSIFAVLLGSAVAFLSLLFDYITGFFVDLAFDSFPSLPEFFSSNLFGYFVNVFRLRDLFQLLFAYLAVHLTCYFSHFIGIPVSYVVKVLRIR